MHHFRVWAPRAKKLAVSIGAPTRRMTGTDAHWELNTTVEHADPGSDYGFIVDDDPQLMPIAAYAGNRVWGYDGMDLFAVSENYGGLIGRAG